VKQAEAVAEIRAQMNAGVLGGVGAGRAFGAGGLLGILAGAGAGRYTYDVLADFQSIETTFRGIFNEVEGRAPRTEAFLDDMRDFAKRTPFALRSLAEYAQKFFANGLVDPAAADATQQLTDKLLKLADAASATGKTKDQIDGAVLGLTQISASGRTSLEDLRQVTEGIGIRFSDVAAELGVSTEEMFKLLSKGMVSSEEGINAVFAAMERIPGAAGAAARQSGNLRGALSNLQDVIDSLIVKYLAPLGVYLARAISAFADFLGKLSEGEGVYKIVRDGLTGIAVALGLIIAAKGAVQVLGLTNKVLLLLAANPGILALTALGAAAGILYERLPGVRSFFRALVSGTVEWTRVGYRMGEAIEGLSLIVTLQSSIGVAGRVIKNSLHDISEGVRGLLAGDGPEQLATAAARFRDELTNGLAPARDALRKPVREAVENAVDYLQGVRLNLGVFLLSAFGLGGGGEGFFSNLISKAIRRALLGAVSDLGSAGGAERLGSKINDFLTQAWAYATSTGIDVGRFFTGLFTGDFDLDNAANNMGVQLRWLIEDGIAKAGTFVEPVRKVLSDAASAVGDFFTAEVLPRIVEIPRIVGRFLSRTVFSEQFLRAVTVGAAAIAGVAVVIAGQFVRGFLEGLWQRRGDIAEVIFDIITFAAKAVLGSGNPFIIIGGALVAAFIGAKVIGAIASLRSTVRVASRAMRGDLAGARIELSKMREEAEGLTGPGLAPKIGNLAASFGRGVDAAGQALPRLASTTLKATEKISAGFDSAGRQVQTYGERILGIEGLSVNAYGRLIDANGRFVKDTTKDLSKLRRTVGQTVIGVGQSLQAIPAQARAGFSQLGDIAQHGLDQIKKQGGKARQYLQENTDSMMAAVGAGLSTFYAAQADGAESFAVGMIGTFSSIFIAFAAGGPIGGAIAIAASAIGYFTGQAKKQADEARAALKKSAEALKSDAKETRAALEAGFSSADSTSGAARIKVVGDLLSDLASKGSKKYRDFANRFDGDTDRLILAAAGGEDAVRDYTNALRDDTVDRILAGRGDAVKDFATQIAKAGGEARRALEDSARTKGGKSVTLGGDLADLFDALERGEVTSAGFISTMQSLGYSTEEARDSWRTYTDALERNVGDTAGGRFLRNLPGQLREAIRSQRESAEIQAEANRRFDAFAPIAEKFESAWGRVKDALDRARNAYNDWIDATTGKQQTRNEAITDLFGAARDSLAAGPEGETAIERDARLSQLRIDALRTLDGQVAQFASESGGDIDVLKGKLNAFFEELKNNAPDQSTKDFFTLLQASVPEDALINALGTEKPIETIQGVQSALGDLFATNKPLQVELEEATSNDEVRRILEKDIRELSESNPQVKAFMGEGPEYEANLQKILNDASYLNSLNPTIKVGIEFVGNNLGAAGDLLSQAVLESIAVVASADGRYITKPTVSTLGEDGEEVVLPLTKPDRMRELLAIPNVRRSIANVAPARVEAPAPAIAMPGSEREVLNLTQHIHETRSPRQTAIESVRKFRTGQHLSGVGLGRRRPLTTGAPT